MPSDLELVYLWRQFSGERYCVNWIDATPVSQKQFKDWLNGRRFSGEEGAGEERTLETLEQRDLPAIRGAYQSRISEAAGNSIPALSKAVRKPQALKDSQKARAVSVAAAIRDGTATASLVREFLQEDIPSFNSETPLPDEPEIESPEIESREELAAEFKAASAFALIKAVGYLIDEDPQPAGEAVDEYLDLRRRAKQNNLSSAIIGLPKDGVAIDKHTRYLICELMGMVTLHSIEDPIERHKALLRLIRNEWPQGVTAEEIIREQRDRY